LEEDISLFFLFHESFPIQSVHHDIHAEMVEGVDPNSLFISGNSSGLVYIKLHISDFIPDLYRGKITLTAKLVHTNYSDTELPSNWRTSVSFYYTVANNGISKNDSDKPLCSQFEECSGGKEDCTKDACEYNTRERVLRVKDHGSGIQSVQVLYPDSAELQYQRFTIGTQHEIRLLVTQSCCDNALSVAVQDLAGNDAICSVGDVPSTSQTSKPNAIFLVACLLYATVNYPKYPLFSL